MKIRPYRVCDICGEEYRKTHNCMKVKILIDPMGYTEMYGDLPIMSKWDICPKLMLKVADRKTEPQRTCDNCGTPRDKCVYCIEEDKMWTPKTEPQTCGNCYYYSDVGVKCCDHEHDPTTPTTEACEFYEPKDESQTERSE